MNGFIYRAAADESISRFLTDLLKDNGTPRRVRLAAYWALREVQLGLTEEDLVKRGICAVKPLLEKNVKMEMSADEMRRALLCGGRYPDSFWDSAETIDWNFVGKFVSGR